MGRGWWMPQATQVLVPSHLTSRIFLPNSLNSEELVFHFYCSFPRPPLLIFAPLSLFQDTKQGLFPRLGSYVSCSTCQTSPVSSPPFCLYAPVYNCISTANKSANHKEKKIFEPLLLCDYGENMTEVPRGVIVTIT